MSGWVVPKLTRHKLALALTHCNGLRAGRRTDALGTGGGGVGLAADGALGALLTTIHVAGPGRVRRGRSNSCRVKLCQTRHRHYSAARMHTCCAECKGGHIKHCVRLIQGWPWPSTLRLCKSVSVQLECPHVECNGVCVTTETRHLDRFGQLGDLEQHRRRAGKQHRLAQCAKQGTDAMECVFKKDAASGPAWQAQ